MKISIVIPSIGNKTLWGVLKGLEKQIEINSQVWWEVIVVFDGQYLNKFIDQEKKYCSKNFKFYEQLDPMLKGRSGARNYGLDRVTGDIVVFLGDDTAPVGDWGKILVEFFQQKKKNTGLLGFVGWAPKLMKDPLHKWLLTNAQFGYTKNLKPNWRHFYTSCIALPMDLIGEERFAYGFNGWGFEDTEFGYRLAQKGMRLEYNKNWQVEHDHSQIWENVLKNTRSAGINAREFERLHPEVKIIPRGIKRFLLWAIVFKLRFIPFKPQKLQWWYEWKRAWLDGTKK